MKKIINKVKCLLIRVGLLRNSRYLFPWVYDSFFKMFIRRMYEDYVAEPFFPEGITRFTLTEKDFMANTPTDQIKIQFCVSDKHINGKYEEYYFNSTGRGHGSEIVKNLCKK